MKTIKTINKVMLGAAVVLALALTGSLPVRAQDQTQPMKPMKGGEHLMMLNKEVKTVNDVNALTNDDSVAMVCAKCKTVWVSRVKQGEKGAQILTERGQATELVGTHACPGCGGTWTITGAGKGAKAVLKHTCTACGDDSAFCCATSKNAGPTEGMEKH